MKLNFVLHLINCIDPWVLLYSYAAQFFFASFLEFHIDRDCKNAFYSLDLCVILYMQDNDD
jgi:hypothetical protein